MTSPALAAVCDKERPLWDGTPATSVSEAIVWFSTPLGLVLLIATAFAIRFRHAWGGLAVVVGWTAFVTYVVTKNTDAAHDLAILEGCIGPPTLFVALSIAICIATIVYTARQTTGKTDGENDA